MNDRAAKVRELKLRRELALRARSPLHVALEGFTREQGLAYHSPAARIVVTGGNQSGKTHWACAAVAAFAAGLHPRAGGPHPTLSQGEREIRNARLDRVVWYCTTNYELFGKQAWEHLKRFLFFEGESCHRLPARRVLEIGWERKSPEQPKYFKVRGADGIVARVYVMSYEAGLKAFMAQTVDLIVIDEECDAAIYRECSARFLASPGAFMLVLATPVKGVPWLRRLKRQALDPLTGIQLFRFRTAENPGASVEEIARLKAQYRDDPQELALRLEGEDKASSGLVYPDTLFTPEHVLDDVTGLRTEDWGLSDREKTPQQLSPQSSLLSPFILDPRRWTLNRCIDAGYRTPGCVWLAVSEDERQVVVYRCWKGDHLTVAEAWESIAGLSKAERYVLDLIDPAVRAKNAVTGASELSVWRSHGFKGRLAPDNTVRSGIERVKDLMRERVELPVPGGRRSWRRGFGCWPVARRGWTSGRSTCCGR
ncbi:MAG: terminase family protein [Planctomycetota bacterium]|nr:terminase family protein [Planctomycetota bacterium]